MPTYEYICTRCGRELEIFQSMKDAPLKRCPSCKKLGLKRKIGGGAGLIFKGSGFYITDYKNKSGGPKEKTGEAKGSEAKSSEGKAAEAKPTTPPSTSKPAAKPAAK